MNLLIPCPSTETLHRLDELQRSSDSLELVQRIEEHIESCQTCQKELEKQLTLQQQSLDGILPEPICGYRILNVLGQGGHACVYLALELSTERLVALKLIPKSTSNLSLVETWRSEILVAARMDHQHLVRLYSVQENSDAFVLVFEYIPGGTLQSQLQRPWTPQQVVSLLNQIAQGVAKIHSMGFLHLDLKPSNILIQRNPKSDPEEWIAKISDFGIALNQPKAAFADPSIHAANEGVLRGIGTLEYMAPEQAIGIREILTPATDIYAMGRILYQWLASMESGVHARLASTTQLRQIAQRCTQIDPSKRYENAKELIEVLNTWMAQYGTSPNSELSASKLGKSVQAKSSLRGSTPSWSVLSWSALVAVSSILVILAMTGKLRAPALDTLKASRPPAIADLGSWILLLDTPPEAISETLSSDIADASNYWTRECIDSGLITKEPEQAFRCAILQRSAAERIGVIINTVHMPLARQLLANATSLLIKLRDNQPDNETVLKELIAAHYIGGMLRYHDDEIPRYDEYFRNRLESFKEICVLIDKLEDPVQQIFWSTRVLDDLRISRRTSAWGGQGSSLDTALEVESSCKALLGKLQENNPKLQTPDLSIRLILADSSPTPSSVFEQLHAQSSIEQNWVFPEDAHKLLRESIATELGIPIFETSDSLPIPFDEIIRQVCTQAALGPQGEAIVPIVFQEDLFRFVAAVSTYHRLTGQLELAVKIQSRYLGLCDALMDRFPDQPCLFLARSEAFLQAWKNKLRQDDDTGALEALRKSYENSKIALELAPNSPLAHHQVSDRLKRITRFQSQSNSPLSTLKQFDAKDNKIFVAR